MQTALAMRIGEQVELTNYVTPREVSVPTVCPMVDAELTATFLRAAVAWARWQERRRWMGR